jgi:flagellar basal-body rod modification protein FlgD
MMATSRNNKKEDELVSTVSSLTSSTSTTSTSSTSSTTSNSELDFEDWINLLATELQYQDPSDPVSSSEYVAQMASLSTLTEMENIYSAMNTVEAYGMIGKTVTYTTTNSSGTTTEVSGTVDSVLISNGNVYLVVDGSTVELDSVVSVANSSSSSSSSSGTTSS